MKLLTKKGKNVVQKEVFQAYVIYIFDIEKMVCELYRIPSIQPVLEITSFKEAFKLDKPAMFFKGKPVFICVRGEAITRSASFTDEGLVLKPSCQTSDEIYAKLKSIHIRKLFGLPGISPQYILLLFLSNVVSILATVIICTQVFGG